MQRRSWLVGWALLTGSAGCYRFEPTTLEAVPEGSTIRAVLTPGAHDRLEQRHGIVTRDLKGTVLTIQGDVLSLWVPSVPIDPTFGARPFYQQVNVPRADFLRVDVRAIDKGRTAMVAIAGAAGLAVVARETLFGGFGSSNNGGGPGPSESRRRWLLPLVFGIF